MHIPTVVANASILADFIIAPLRQYLYLAVGGRLDVMHVYFD
jgi:hypothetical protein